MFRILFLLAMLISPLYSLEVRTANPPPQNKAQERVHYHSFAAHFANTLKNHPPVTDCHVKVFLTDFKDLEDRLEIIVEIDRPSLITHLGKERNTTFITTRDSERYLDSFGQNIKQAAHEVFTDIKIEAIKVTINIIE